ncbi:hypothetical protein ACJJI4_07850 [Microbulbifer sp. TRSA002]|uniref:hypothetical protein n=1 Tax=Microbulbifer sp. TRSA002 TaxID=3243382 RepID=UPI00403A30E1
MTEEVGSREDRYWKYIYSSKLRIKRRVLRMERLAARRLSLLLVKERSLDDWRFATSLEFLLTWKLKTGCCPDIMWCDGVEFEDIHIAGKRAIRFSGSAWIGPEGADNVFQVPLEAYI